MRVAVSAAGGGRTRQDESSSESEEDEARSTDLRWIAWICVGEELASRGREEHKGWVLSRWRCTRAAQESQEAAAMEWQADSASWGREGGRTQRGINSNENASWINTCATSTLPFPSFRRFKLHRTSSFSSRRGPSSASASQGSPPPPRSSFPTSPNSKELLRK